MVCSHFVYTGFLYGLICLLLFVYGCLRGAAKQDGIPLAEISPIPSVECLDFLFRQWYYIGKCSIYFGVWPVHLCHITVQNVATAKDLLRCFRQGGIRKIMTDNELSKLNRKELLEILLKLSVENQELRGKLKRMEASLHDRQIKIDAAGSIAEASLQLNGVFESAQAACKQYMENIEALSQRQEAVCARMEAESQARANAMLQNAQAQCDEMIKNAQAQSAAYWDDVSVRLERFYNEHAGLQALLGIATQRFPAEQETGL